MTIGILPLLLLQNTWVVDDNAGPGVNFTDLPPAVAAAADGDILLVQPGTYSHFTLTGKGLRILGSDASTTFIRFDETFPYGSPTTISNVPSGSLVYIDRVTFEHNLLSGPTLHLHLLIQGGTTRVALADVSLPFSSGFNQDQGIDANLRVDGAEVWVFRSALVSQWSSSDVVPSGGSSALDVLGGAIVHLSGCALKGADYLGCGSCACAPATNGGRGARIRGGSTVWIADGTVSGGSPGCCFLAGCWPCASGGHAIQVESAPGGGASFLRISGDSTSLVTGGPGMNGSSFPGCPPIGNSYGGDGILSIGAMATVHSVPVFGGDGPAGAGLPASGPGITLDATPLPVLQVTGNLTLSGGSATVSLTNGPAGAPFFVGVSGVPDHVDAGPLFLGELLIDPTATFVLFSGSLSSLGETSLVIPLTGLPANFTYFPFYLQGIALDPSGTFWRVSNSTVATIRP
ncbi:MAG: hypothetical protein L0323_20610 [Planctomycetes bacterium]|nr:hypothetical protein [Planctomycetota bacterium]